MRKIGIYILVVLLLGYIDGYADNKACSISGSVVEELTGNALDYASVAILQGNQVIHSSMTDGKGHFAIADVKRGEYTVKVSYIGYNTYYKKIDVNAAERLLVSMKTTTKSLNEIVVTASESRRATSSSRIDATAMKHLQPSSFSDLLELLPGGKSADPSLGGVNSIHLREAGSTSEDISSLGISFVVDDVVQNNDANLQYISGTLLGSGLSSVSKGVDMRTIPTDNIESVEIVRGIPSVSYGNITGGTVIINRKNEETPFTARFKADLKSRLFSAGKGFRLDDSGQRILNVDVNYLDSKIDVTDNRKNYTRFTTSLRLNNKHSLSSGQLMKWSVSADYTGSFDHIKQDKDANVKLDAFHANYNSLGMAGKWQMDFSAHSWLKELKAGVSVKQEWDKMEETRSVSIDRPMAIPNSMVQGEADGLYLPYQYVANMLIDGRPLYANANASAKMSFRVGQFISNLNAGLDWNIMKNFGDGQVYDTTRPLNYSTTVRPRSYNDIPSLQNLSAYAEEEVKTHIGRHIFTLSAGVRIQSLLGLSDSYTMSGKMYADPRFNIQWNIPVGRDWRLNVSGGLGWLSRMPTQAQLFPDAKYIDIVELNYYSTNVDSRRVYLMTYKWDNTNYDLQPARNLKWELRGDVSYKGNRLSVTYFREAMNNAFNTSSYYRILPYKDYADPTLSTFSPDTLIDTYSSIGNDKRVHKQGVEFQFTSRRIDALKTRVTINGAWFKTIYSTNSMQYKSQSILINNKQLSYVGLYNWEDGTEYESFNTNFMFDTYLQRLGLTISLSAQCTWYTSTRNLWNDGVPVAYVGKNGVTQEFTEADRNDVQLQHLIENYASSYFDRISVPFAMDFNIKASKDIGKNLTIALFVNRMVSVYPDYYRGTQLVRRSSSPYFGMEANLRF